jgi:class 3 adenylate cyclase/tetratricopeptide (TPR) repeat protein
VQTCPRCGEQNPEGARFCNACGAALATETREQREERKVVSVLFCDLVGFTAQAEGLDPEDVRALLAPHHARLRAELERFGGTVEKFIGDAVMALFGAPVAHEDDPERAVRAALAIRDAIVGDGDLEIRIGITTGEALIALGARPEAGEGMASGDVVNVAARLETAAPVNGVLVDETTYRSTQRAVDYREAEPVEAKGKAEPIPVWEALETTSRFGIDLAEQARTPLIGRSRELEVLVSLLARVREERAPQLVTLVGVPGMGKSRLVYELFQVVDREPELITWRQGRCLPYGEGVTFWALGEIVKAQAGILETDGTEQVEEKLHRAVGRVVTDEIEARWLEGELRPLAGLTADGTRGDRREGATAAWRRFLEAVAEDGPAVLVCEDLHWADDGLLDFLDDLVDWVRGVPLLVVGTARPELLDRREAWGGGKANATTISLPPLRDEETARLISDLLGQPVQLAKDQQALLERAGGNPLFAEQYVRMLAERGTAGDLPESVQGIIAARLDALSSAEKELLQDAAVFGKIFWIGAVATATGIESPDAERLLRTLERKEFVRRERRTAVAGDIQYAFQHVLLRDVAYSQIPRRSRAEKHRRAAEWTEGLGRPDDHAEMLAHHYRHALELARAAGVDDDPSLVKRAWESLRDAGERTMSLSASASAAEFFALALEVCPRDDPDRPRLLLGHGRALFASGGAGLELLTEALEAFRAVGDVEGAAEAATMAARFSWVGGDRAATDRYIGVALDILVDRPVSRSKAEALTNQSGFHMLAGRYDESIRVGAQAFPLVEELGMDEQRARLHIVVGTARWGLGDSEGLHEIERGISIARAAGALEMAAIGLDNLDAGLFCLGRLADARRAWRRLVELGERYGFARLQRGAKMQSAGWAFADGRWDDALGVADELIAAADAGDRHFTDATVFSLRASIRLARGDPAGADADSERAVELARDSDAQAQSVAFCVRAAIAIDAARHGEAGELASELAAIGRVLLPALNAPFPAFAAAGWVFKDLGREDEFSVVLEATPIESPWKDAARAITEGDFVRAAEIIDEMGHAASAAYARLRAAEALAAVGRRPEAEAQFAQAQSFYRKVGAATYLRRGEELVSASA